MPRVAAPPSEGLSRVFYAVPEPVEGMLRPHACCLALLCGLQERNVVWCVELAMLLSLIPEEAFAHRRVVQTDTAVGRALLWMRPVTVEICRFASELPCAVALNASEIQARQMAQLGIPIAKQHTLVKFSALFGDVRFIGIIMKVFPDARIDEFDAEQLTPFFIACRAGHLPMVKHFFGLFDGGTGSRFKVDFNSRNSLFGLTPFYIACYYNQIRIVRFLASQLSLVDVRARNSRSVSPFCAACYRGNIEVVKFLLELVPSELNAADKFGATPFFVACAQGRLPVVEFLANNGADVNAEDVKRTTPFLISIKEGHIDVARYLSKIPGIDMMRSRHGGLTPMKAARNYRDTQRSSEMIEFLLSIGVVQ